MDTWFRQHDTGVEQLDPFLKSQTNSNSNTKSKRICSMVL